MPDLPITQLDSMHLRNFRRFADLSIEFHPELTVIVAENGGGKTALLDAIAIALTPLTEGLRLHKPRGIDPTDMRRVLASTGSMITVAPTALDATGLVDGLKTQWHRELAALDAKTDDRGADALAMRARGLRHDLQQFAERKQTAPPLLPLVAYYGTARLWRKGKPSDPTSKAPVDLVEQTEGYRGALDTRTTFSQVAAWLEQFVREAQNEVTTGSPSPYRPQEILSAVRRASDIVLEPSGWNRVDWDFVAAAVVAHHPERGRLPVGLLSDGVRNLVALVMDLAHRSVRLNPHLGAKACEESRGIVLIDEVDMHLHPSWQQTVLPLLRRAFPHVQLIVTTHSHLVVSTVKSESIRVLEPDGTVTTPGMQVQGAESPYALALVFGVDSVAPLGIARDTSRLRALIQAGQLDTDEAQALRVRITEHFGPVHPTTLDIEGLERLQRFKARKSQGGL